MSGQQQCTDGAGPSSGEVALTTASASLPARGEDLNNQGGAPTSLEVRNLELGHRSRTSRDDGASGGGGSYYLNDDRDLSSKPNKGAGGAHTGAADEGDPALMEDVPPEKQVGLCWEHANIACAGGAVNAHIMPFASTGCKTYTSVP